MKTNAPVPSAAATERSALLAQLQKEEIDLRDHLERVAQMRRGLGPGPVIGADYRLSDANDRKVHLSQLFGAKDELIVYHFMYAPDDNEPCPMCNMWADGLDAVEPHVSDRATIVLIGKARIAKLNAWARQRHWRHIRVFSSFGTTFNADFGAEDASGDQLPGVSVFTRDADGKVRHFYTKHAEIAPNVNRGIDQLTPAWNLFDLLPSGREDWYPKISY